MGMEWYTTLTYCLVNLIPIITRMHSSRMRTGRSLTVCWRLCLGGGLVPGVVWSGGGCLLWGDLVPGGCLLWGVCSGGGWSGGSLLPGGGMVSQHAEVDTLPPLWTEPQTPVKTLPWPNFVAAGN